MYEIEQKFQYKKIPFEDLQCRRHTVIYRKYISICPEIRINRRCFDSGEERYNLTIKDDSKLKRTEVKVKLEKEQYEIISSMILKDDLVFDIYEFDLDEKHLISFKAGRNVDVRFAEVEYETMKDYELYSKVVENLPFISTEVTYDNNYYMKNIWERIYGR